MAFPSFTQFRRGTPLELAGGVRLTYDELTKLGLQDFYIRIIHEGLNRGDVPPSQLQSWLRALRSNDRALKRAVQAEIGALRVVPVAGVTSAGQGPARTRSRAERVVTLLSRGDHRQAVRDALAMRLTPVQVPAHTLRPGQAPEAHTVQAPERLAAKLITSGNWKSADC